MSKKNVDLIRQALGAAESSIKLAKQLLNDLESGKVDGNNQNSDPTKNLPGLTGSFDGENMVTASGETFPVPANYASKSMLVVGDILKLVEEGKEKRFKQIEHVKRHRTTGILTKKEGKWKAITPEGSYKVLPVTVEHLGAEVGSEVALHLPANNLNVAFAAIESLKSGVKIQTPEAQEPKKENTEDTSSKEVSKPKPLENVIKESPKPVIKPEVKVAVQKKEEVVEDKNPKEPKQEDKPKVTQPKASVTSTKPEIAKSLPPAEPKVEPAASVQATAPATKPIETVSTAVESKPMEISPEEDELT